MPIVAIGVMRLDVRSQLVHFQSHTAKALDEALGAPGCLHEDASQDGKLFYSVSVWENEASMQAFVTMKAYAYAVRRLPRYGASLVFLKYTSNDIPNWSEAFARWNIRESAG